MALVIPEKRINHIFGRAIPKTANDQNTDDIMPARFLKEITFKNMGNYVYADERFNGIEKVYEHPFNSHLYAGANILLAGANYGCGSSREHAPQGLYRFGIRAIVAESFAEIFAANCAMIGLVPVTMARNNLEILAEEAKADYKPALNLNLEEKHIQSANGHEFKVDIPQGRRQAFLCGTWDSMAVLQQNPDEVEAVGKSLPYLS